MSINGDHQFLINFGPQQLYLFFFENLNFQFSSKTHFLDHNFQDPSCRICSYGPHGPFWFSVKNRPDMVKRYPKHNFWGNDLLRLLWTWNYFLEVCSEKLPYVGCSCSGLYFWQINISGNFWHVHFGKSVHFLIFGHFPDDADDGGAPTILPSGQTPIIIAHSAQGSNILFGNPSLRLYVLEMEIHLQGFGNGP